MTNRLTYRLACVSVLALSLTGCAMQPADPYQQMVSQCITAYDTLDALATHVQTGSLPRDVTIHWLETADAMLGPICPPQPGQASYAAGLLTVEQILRESLVKRAEAANGRV